MAHSNLLVYLAATGHASPHDYLIEARRFDAKLTRAPQDPPLRGVIGRPGSLCAWDSCR